MAIDAYTNFSTTASDSGTLSSNTWTINLNEELVELEMDIDNDEFDEEDELWEEEDDEYDDEDVEEIKQYNPLLRKLKPLDIVEEKQTVFHFDPENLVLEGKK